MQSTYKCRCSLQAKDLEGQLEQFNERANNGPGIYCHVHLLSSSRLCFWHSVYWFAESQAERLYLYTGETLVTSEKSTEYFADSLANFSLKFVSGRLYSIAIRVCTHISRVTLNGPCLLKGKNDIKETFTFATNFNRVL